MPVNVWSELLKQWRNLAIRTRRPAQILSQNLYKVADREEDDVRDIESMDSQGIP